MVTGGGVTFEGESIAITNGPNSPTRSGSDPRVRNSRGQDPLGSLIRPLGPGKRVLIDLDSMAPEVSETNWIVNKHVKSA